MGQPTFEYSTLL